MGIVDTLNFQLRLVGQAAIKNALAKLNDLAQGTQRSSETEKVEMGDLGLEKTSQKLVSDDLEAAKALAKLGIDALKLSRSPLTDRSDDKAQKDLFDLAQSDPWKLKRPE